MPKNDELFDWTYIYFVNCYNNIIIWKQANKLIKMNPQIRMASVWTNWPKPKGLSTRFWVRVRFRTDSPPFMVSMAFGIFLESWTKVPACRRKFLKIQKLRFCWADSANLRKSLTMRSGGQMLKERIEKGSRKCRKRFLGPKSQNEANEDQIPSWKIKKSLGFGAIRTWWWLIGNKTWRIFETSGKTMKSHRRL